VAAQGGLRFYVFRGVAAQGGLRFDVFAAMWLRPATAALRHAASFAVVEVRVLPEVGSRFG
jgi:hypothetical protein